MRHKDSRDGPLQDEFGWQLQDVPAIILGAGAGIGGECARLLVARGARVMLGDIVCAAAERTQADVANLGDCHVGEVNVLDRASLKEFFAAASAKIGTPQVVIDVVGRAQGKVFADVTEDDWDSMLSINLRQQFLVAQEALPYLIETHGTLTFIGSINGTHSSPRQVPYGAAKAGLASLTKSLAIEYAHTGVRFNAVAPSVALTPRMREFYAQTGRLDEFATSLPMGRVSESSEVAQIAVFLGSPLASYVSGQVIGVDGGASVKYPQAVMSDDD
jgi:NAD(P)-dependent dehydrogenase (short-subunit alcohol dehydrogenase family)